MRLLVPVALAIATSGSAQYGSFSTAALKTASANTTLVVLDGSNTGYNAAMTNAIKADWKFTSGVDFINTNDLATQPIDPTKNYVMKITRVDKEKHAATFIALVAGWKQKKGEELVVENNAVTNIPPAQELASIMVDPKVINETGTAMIGIYVKHLQDYIKQVQAGKITDKATADRLYAGRNRLIKDMSLWLAQNHMDKTIPDLNKVKETYTHNAELVDLAKCLTVAESGESGVALSDVVLTGEYKTKWCFKRIFNANTGELMYLRDDAALYEKKEGFIAEDLRMLEQSR
ncbi:MAG: hypothetical protein KA791_15955 [Flavobacteriales bacterium]|nr:hypothetical protein [Flavobacteriales bacterium]